MIGKNFCIKVKPLMIEYNWFDNKKIKLEKIRNGSVIVRQLSSSLDA